MKLAQHGGEPVIITEQGRASAVLLDYETYRGLIETTEEMSSSDGRKLLQQAKKEAAKQKLIPHNIIVEKF